VRWAHGDRIREIRAVEERPPAGGATHDVDAEAAAGVVVDVVIGLEATQ
jgi:hypothetical protein